MIIRPMEQDDADAVSAIEAESFSMPWTKQGFLDALDMESNILLVAEENGEILGYECTYMTIDEGELTNIAVRKDQRGNGIAEQLLRQLRAEALRVGVERIVLEVRVSNAAAISLYEKVGFINLGIRKNLYERPTEDGYIMSLSVEEDEC